MITIHLHNLKFNSFHGLNIEEKMVGNEFEVNVDVAINATEKINDLSQTVDYASIYRIIELRMQKQTALLETLVQDLAELIHAADKRIQSINVNVKKIHTPLSNFEGEMGVSYKKEF